MSDLLKTGDREWLHAFIKYLVAHRAVKKDDLVRVLQLQSEIDTRVGSLAALKGYITPRDVYYILSIEKDSREPFGEAAVRQGLLSRKQLDELLRMQSNPFYLFLECLALTRLLPGSQLREHLERFVKATGRVAPSRLDLDADLMQELSSQDLRGREKQLWATLKRVKSLATVPAVVQRVLTLLGDPQVRLPAVSNELQTDPALCAQLLRVANSAFFGMRGQVATVDRAVITLGINAVRQLVLAAAVLGKFKDVRIDDAKALWRHSVFTAHLARLLGRARGMERAAEDAFGAGLLHDMGKLVLLQHFPEALEEIRNMVRAGSGVEQAEREVLGTTHPDIGAYLCHFWSFPEALAQATLYHHAPIGILKSVKGLLSETMLVHAACRLASLPLDRLDGGLAGLDDEFVAFHALDTGAVAEVIPGVAADTEQIVATLFADLK